LNVSHPTTVTEIKANFTVTKLSLNQCAANSAEGATVARPGRLLLTRFNDGSGSAATGDQTGDFRAVVQLFRDGASTDPPGVLHVQGVLLRCSNPSCSVRPAVVSATLPTTVSVGETHNLKLIWDSPNNQFLFDLANSGAPTPLPYSAADNAMPAIGPFVEVDVQSTAANCTAGPITIDSTTLVGKVKTNAAAVIP
jgi:hypothetical protein